MQERYMQIKNSHAELETHLQMHELAPDAGTSIADLWTHLQMHELTPDAGTSLAGLGTHLQMQELSQMQESHLQIKDSFVDA